jgi:hypothetical protein
MSDIAKRRDADIAETANLVANFRREYHRVANLPADLRGGVTVRYDPNAERVAEAMLAERQPAKHSDIIEWLGMLHSGGAQNMTGEQLTSRNSAILFALEDLPRICWTRATCKIAMTKLRFYPSVAELVDILQPIADEHEAIMRFAGQYASAPPASTFGARAKESSTPYELPPPPPEMPARRPIPSTAAEEAEAKGDRQHQTYQPPIRTVEQQIAAILGTKGDKA